MSNSIPDILLGDFFSSEEWPCAFSNGVTTGLLGTYYGDVIANIINQDKGFLEIRSDFGFYLAGVLAGGVGGITALYLDSIANNALVLILLFVIYFSYDAVVNENERTLSKDSQNLLFDLISITIILSVFGKNSLESYLSHTPAVTADTDFLVFFLTNIYFALRE